MKYLLKQNKEDKGILCDKVTIDGFDYYVSEEQPVKGWYYDTFINKIKNTNGADYAENEITKQVIATNNSTINIPKVVDMVETLAKRHSDELSNDDDAIIFGFMEGYNKSQETHPFSEEDMVDFANWVQTNYYCVEINIWLKEGNYYTTKELLQLWKEQKPKIVYYE